MLSGRLLQSIKPARDEGLEHLVRAIGLGPGFEHPQVAAAFEDLDLDLAAERGRQWQTTVPGNYVSGQLAGSAQLSSGRFAMIDDGLGFSLVPWRPALEQHIGRYISGVAMPGGDVDWAFGRSRGLGL
jgi:hypothetical protein